MKLNIVTVNGTRYEFWNEGNRTFFKRQGSVQRGEVLRLRNESICVGRPIRMDVKEGSTIQFGETTDTVSEMSVIL